MDGVPLASYRDLTLLTNEPSTLAAFWGTALRMPAEQDPTGEFRLVGSTDSETIHIHPTTLRKTRRRVHLDITTPDLAALRRAGATVGEGVGPWRLSVDPEDREIGVLVHDDSLQDRLYQVVIDSPEPEANAAWWAKILDTHLHPVPEDPDIAFVEPVPGAPFESLVFAREPEPKIEPNSVRLNVITFDVELLTLHGATMVGPDGSGGTLACDPYGNEFGVYPLGTQHASAQRS